MSKFKLKKSILVFGPARTAVTVPQHAAAVTTDSASVRRKNGDVSFKKEILSTISRITFKDSDQYLNIHFTTVATVHIGNIMK